MSGISEMMHHTSIIFGLLPLMVLWACILQRQSKKTNLTVHQNLKFNRYAKE